MIDFAQNPTLNPSANSFHLTIIALGLALTTALYAGWQQFSLVLARGGAYRHLCPPDFHFDRLEGPCGAQDDALQLLLPLGGAAEIAAELFGGLALDFCGLWQTASVGLLLNGVAYAIMGASLTPIGYLDPNKFAIVLTGIAINLIYFPALDVRHHFREHQSLVVSFVVASQLLSELVAPVVWIFWINLIPRWTLGWLFVLYFATIYLPCSLLYVYVIRSISTPVILLRESSMSNRERKIQSVQAEASKLVKDVSVFQDSPVDKVSASPPSTAVAEADTLSPLEIHFPYPINPETTLPVPRSDFLLKTVSTINQKLSALYQANQDVILHIFTWNYLAIILLSTSFLVQAFYYQMVVRNIGGVRLSAVFGWLMPLDSVISLALGRFADLFGPCTVLKCTSVFFCVAYATLAIPNSWAKSLGLLPFICGLSFAWTAKHVCIAGAYPASVYGRLVGLGGALGGLTVLLLLPILEVYVNHIIGSITLAIWSLVCYVIAWRLGLTRMMANSFEALTNEDI